MRFWTRWPRWWWRDVALLVFNVGLVLFWAVWFGASVVGIVALIVMPASLYLAYSMGARRATEQLFERIEQDRRAAERRVRGLLT